MSIPYPRAFDGTAYTRRLHPLSLSVYLSLDPLSTANMTVPITDEIESLDWVQIFTPDGGSGYYRVTSVSTDVVRQEKSVYLEHGACTLGDQMIPDVSTDVAHTGSHGANLVSYAEDKTDTISNLLTYILAKQGTGARWTAGTVEATETIYIELGGMTLLDCITTMMQYIPDYQLEFVQASESNWVVNIKARPTTPLCEARLSRNIENCDVSYNTSSVVTRVYCEGITNGHMDSTNVATYGLREETQMLSDNLSAAQKEAIVSAYLRNHDHPAVSITISGQELAQLTGLSIDAFQVGKVCRLALPSMEYVANEVIIDKRYSDVYGDPENVSITLANATPDLVIAMATITSGGGGGMAGKIKQAEKQKKRFETHFEQTDEYFRLIATDTQWDDLGNGTVTAYGQIVLTSTSFQAVVSNIGDNGTITAASIALAINEAGSNAYIDADHIYLNAAQEITLSGMVHATGTTFQIEDGVTGDATLTCGTIECMNLEVGSNNSGSLHAPYAQFNNMNFDGEDVEWKSQSVVTGVTITFPSFTRSSTRHFVYAVNDDLNNLSTASGQIVSQYSSGSTNVSTNTIYYLGKAVSSS